MNYVSTRGQAPVLGFGEAMLTGLARDGGLYVPQEIPAISADQIAALAGLSYEEAAFRIMRPFVGDALTTMNSALPSTAPTGVSAMHPARP